MRFLWDEDANRIDGLVRGTITSDDGAVVCVLADRGRSTREFGNLIASSPLLAEALALSESALQCAADNNTAIGRNCTRALNAARVALAALRI